MLLFYTITWMYIMGVLYLCDPNIQQQYMPQLLVTFLSTIANNRHCLKHVCSFPVTLLYKIYSRGIMQM